MEHDLTAHIRASTIPQQFLYRCFYILAQTPDIGTKELVRSSRLPLAIVKRLLQEFNYFFAPHQEKPGYVVLTSDGLHQIQQLLNDYGPMELNNYNWVSPKASSESLISQITVTLSNRNIPKRSLDQFPCTDGNLGANGQNFSFPN